MLAIEQSQKLSDGRHCDYVLDGRNIHPHITIYSPEFPSRNLDRLLAEIESVVKRNSEFSVTFDDPVTEDSYIVVKLKDSPDHKALHMDVLTAANPLREGVLRKKYMDEELLAGLDHNARRNISKYGYDKVRDNYPRHISIIKYSENETAEKQISSLEWGIREMKVQNIGVFEMGPFGTCTKLVSSFHLKSV